MQIFDYQYNLCNICNIPTLRLYGFFDLMDPWVCFDTFTFAVLNITIKYKCIFEKKSCSELTLTLVLNDYELNQTATLLIGEPSQLEL